MDHRCPLPWESEPTNLLFWYAVHRERCGDPILFDAILRLKKRLLDRWSWDRFTWHLGASKMFIYASPRAAVLAVPYIHWQRETSDADAKDLISKWMEAISEVSRTEEVAGSVVDALLQIAANRHLRPSIPADLWLWLNERPSLPPACSGLSWGCDREIVRAVRGLENIGVLTSYLILIWSKWEPLDYGGGFAEMRASVREDFKGTGTGCHRVELIRRLDYILGELDRLSQDSDVCPEDEKLWHDKLGDYSEDMMDRYGELKGILQEVDQEATETPNRMPPSFISLSSADPRGPAQTLTPPSCVPCLSRIHELPLGTIGTIPG